MSTETPLELKRTVNLPKTGFAQKANLGQSEPARLKKWKAPAPNYTRGVLAKYARSVKSASLGAVTD